MALPSTLAASKSTVLDVCVDVSVCVRVFVNVHTHITVCHHSRTTCRKNHFLVNFLNILLVSSCWPYQSLLMDSFIAFWSIPH